MPRLLDLYCGAGGCSKGYADAGFEVVGVDIEPQPHYPFEFHQANALEYPLEGFDAYHASPPCQVFAAITARNPYSTHEHINLIPQTRDRLRATLKPFVIENVPEAPLINPIILCGGMFVILKVYRHRGFESNILLTAPTHREHRFKVAEVGRPVESHGWMTVAGHFSNLKAAQEAMRINWMNKDEIAEAIPPMYTQYIGKQLIKYVNP